MDLQRYAVDNLRHVQHMGASLSNTVDIGFFLNTPLYPLLGPFLSPVMRLLSLPFLFCIPSMTSAFVIPSTSLERGGALDESQSLQDYRPQASALFGNIRIPAALFAGASAGAAFAMPILATDASMKLGLVKRLYALLLLGALSCEVVAVVVSTLAVGALSTGCQGKEDCNVKTTSVAELLQEYYSLEWVTARLHFLAGVVLFLVGVGMRAWVTIACPVISKAALGMIVSSTFLCLAFIQELKERSTGASILDGVVRMPLHYLRLLFHKAREKKPLFQLAFVSSLGTAIYIIAKTPHILKWLASVGGAM